MKKQYNKILCVIITLFIFVSGMCLEIPRADSLFACLDNSSITSYISSSKGMPTRHELSGRETMGARIPVFVSDTSRKTDLRTTIRNSLVLSLTEAFLLKLSNLQIVTEIVCASETHFITSLLNYLHRKDGKK